LNQEHRVTTVGTSSNAKRKGHILILVENLPVPFDRRVWMESLALTEAGYKVSVISPCPPDELNTPDRVIEGIHVYRYPMPAPTKGKLSFFREFSYCLWVTHKLTKRIWREDRFDVIQTCNPPDTFWLIGRQYKKRGVKFVFDHHDLCPELYESKFNRRDFLYKGLSWFEKKQFQTADAVIATNESYKEVAIRRGGKRPEDVAIVRSGPMLQRFVRVPEDATLRRGKKHLVVYLGVMGPQDGVDYALRAIRHAVDAGCNDAFFTFVGKGDSFDDLVALTKELKLNDHVSFTGRVSDDDLKRYLSTASLGIAPDPKNALNDVSTMNKIIEYMAMSIPIVSFDLIESRRSAEEAAVYIANDDEKKMGLAIIELLGNPAQREKMGKIGRERVEKTLAWDYSKKVLVSFYDRLLSRG
jgi:glycosyltransferase involved in cell wall biosynthesis